MPNRIIKESICTSDTLDQLSWFEEVVFYRLVVNCDDYGRFDGRIPIIKNRLFPLKEKVTNKSIAEAINKLSTAGLVIPYEYDGKPILQLVTWDKHQTVRNKRSKYPAIDGSEETTATENVRLLSIESNCMQLNANVTVIQSNPIQSESESISESESKGRMRALDAFADFAGDNELLLQALRDFEDMRKKIRKPMTDKAKQMLVEKLQKLSPDAETQIAILNQSILHSWQDVYGLKDKPTRSANPALDRLREMGELDGQG